MNLEQLKKMTTSSIEELAASLSAGRSEALNNYLATMGRFHRYSLHNVMLIALQRPTASHVAGFRTWQKLGRFVRKGEKGIVILVPLVRRNPVTDEVTSDKPLNPVYGFRPAYVFDVTQTDGSELPSIGQVQGHPQQHLERLISFVRDSGIVLDYSAEIAPALGTSAGGRITLLPGMGPAREFSALAHELAHEFLHRTERRKNTTRTMRETEAEAVAYVVSKGIGLETGSASQDYIQLWHGDAAILMESLELIHSTSSRILASLHCLDAGNNHCDDRLDQERLVPYAAGDHVKFEIRDDKTGESEWMWLKVERTDESSRVVFGILDSQPVVFAHQMRLGQQLAVSFDNIRDHRPQH